MSGFYQASANMTDRLVRHLREFFLDADEIRKITNSDFTILGQQFSEGQHKQPYHLISARFPDRFRLYPHILVNCSVQRPIKVQANNLLAQHNAIGSYGRHDVDFYMHGGALSVNVSLTIRAMDEYLTEQISDLLIYYSLYYGWEYFKKTHWFMEPFSGSAISADNYRDSSDSIRVYRSNLSTSMRGHWTREVYPDAPPVGKITTHTIVKHFVSTDVNIYHHIHDSLVFTDKIGYTHPTIKFSDGVFLSSESFDEIRNLPDGVYEVVGSSSLIFTESSNEDYVGTVSIGDDVSIQTNNVGFLEYVSTSENFLNFLSTSVVSTLYDTNCDDNISYSDGNQYYSEMIETVVSSLTLSTSLTEDFTGFLSDISGIQYWFEADSPRNILNQSSISQLTDKSSNGFSATQPTGSAQPELVSNVLNGLPAMRVDGVNSFMSIDGLALDMARNVSGFTVGCLIKPSTVSGTGYLFTVYNNSTASRIALIRSTNKIMIAGRQNDADTAQTGTSVNSMTTSSWYFVYAIMDYVNDRMIIRENNNTEQVFNVTWGSGATSSNTSSSGIYLFSSSGGPALCFAGDVVGVVGYNKILNSGELTSLRSYWSTRYNLGLI